MAIRSQNSRHITIGAYKGWKIIKQRKQRNKITDHIHITKGKAT